MTCFLRTTSPPPRSHPPRFWGMLVETTPGPPALGPGLVGEDLAFPERLCFSRTFSGLFPARVASLTFPLVVLLESSSPREGERPRSVIPGSFPGLNPERPAAAVSPGGVCWWHAGPAPPDRAEPALALVEIRRPRHSQGSVPRLRERSQP